MNDATKTASNWDATRVKKLRETLGMNKKQFARLLASDLRTVMRWENADPPRKPSGAAGAVMRGIQEKLDKDPNSTTRVVERLNLSNDIGGLAYIIFKGLDQ